MRRAALFMLLAGTSGTAFAREAVDASPPSALSVTVYRDPYRAPESKLDRAWPRGFAMISETRQVTLPAIMPQFITTLRVTSGVAWMVVVAAEMLAGSLGLGFAVWDSRNGLRTDYLVCVMIVIGAIGVGIDWLLSRLTRLPNVRWGYEA